MKATNNTGAAMNITVDKEINTKGTAFREKVIVSYDRLVDIFGLPTHGPNHGQSQCEWHLNVDGEAVTIYDIYSECPVFYVKEWNIGAKNIKSSMMVKYKILEPKSE